MDKNTETQELAKHPMFKQDFTFLIKVDLSRIENPKLSNAMFSCLPNLIHIKLGKGGEIPVGLCQNCRALKTCDLGEVLSIGENAFLGCRSLTKVLIPASVTVIKNGAFYYCTNLNTVQFAEGSRRLAIEEHVFAGCERLTWIELPQRLMKASHDMFTLSGLRALVTPFQVSLTGMTYRIHTFHVTPNNSFSQPFTLNRLKLSYAAMELKIHYSNVSLTKVLPHEHERIYRVLFLIMERQRNTHSCVAALNYDVLCMIGSFLRHSLVSEAVLLT